MKIGEFVYWVAVAFCVFALAGIVYYNIATTGTIFP